MTLTNRTDPYHRAAQEDRCGQRVRITIPARLRVSCARPVETMVNDLSLSGFSAVAIHRMHPGSICWLTLPGLESLQAEVVWWEDNLCGCAFVDLLSPIVLDNILARFKDGGSNRLR